MPRTEGRNPKKEEVTAIKSMRHRIKGGCKKEYSGGTLGQGTRD